MKRRTIQIFEAMSHHVRLRMIQHMGSRPRRMDELSEMLKINVSSVSHHLQVLRDAGLLVTERRGLPAYHSIDRPVLAAALDDLATAAKLGRGGARRA
jgi:ArsR family transcriptional regulator